MTTPSDFDRVIVDSTGWIEYFGEGKKSAAFASYIEGKFELLMPAIIVYELSRKLLRERGQQFSERFYSFALGFNECQIPFDAQLAMHAARLGLQFQLPMVDAIIYATAQAHGAQLITSDTHFSGLTGVTLL